MCLFFLCFIGWFLAMSIKAVAIAIYSSGCRNQETREGTYGTAADSNKY